MGEKLVKFSDLSGTLLKDDDITRVVVGKHAAIEHAVAIEVSGNELAAIEKAAVNVTELSIEKNGETVSITVDTEAFNKLFTESPVDTTLQSAKKAGKGKAKTNGHVPVDYTTLEHAGSVHRGKVTDAEKKVVAANLDTINERLAANGERVIDLNDPTMVERYGLQALAKERQVRAKP